MFEDIINDLYYVALHMIENDELFEDAEIDAVVNLYTKYADDERLKEQWDARKEG